MSSFEEPLNQEQNGVTSTVPVSRSPSEPVTPGLSSHRESLGKSHLARGPRGQRPSFFWPLLLIAGGIMLLLSNLGYLPWRSWSVLWRLWPLLLVALGMDLLIGRRSAAGAIISAFLVAALIGGMVLVGLFAQSIPALEDWIQPVGSRTEHIEYSLAGLESASVYIDWTSVPGSLDALRDSGNLIEGDIDYRGELTFEVDVRGERAEVVLDSHFSGVWFGPDSSGDRTGDRWDVRLSPEVPLDLSLDAGSGPGEFDLSGLQINTLNLNGGSGPVAIALPSSHTFDAIIDGGSGPMSITLPETAGVRVVIDSGTGPFSAGERLRLVEGSQRGDSIWETDNLRSADHTIVLEIDQGSGPVTIR